MLKQPNIVRALVIQTMYHLRLRLTQLPETETDAILALGGSRDSHPENMSNAVNLVLVHLGMPPPTVKDVRFDKTYRAIAKKRLKGPRGVNTRGGQDPTEGSTHGEA